MRHYCCTLPPPTQGHQPLGPCAVGGSAGVHVAGSAFSDLRKQDMPLVDDFPLTPVLGHSFAYYTATMNFRIVVVPETRGNIQGREGEVTPTHVSPLNTCDAHVPPLAQQRLVLLILFFQPRRSNSDTGGGMPIFRFSVPPRTVVQAFPPQCP